LFLNFLNIQKSPAHKISSYVHGLKIRFLSETVVKLRPSNGDLNKEFRWPPCYLNNNCVSCADHSLHTISSHGTGSCSPYFEARTTATWALPLNYGTTSN